MAGNDDLSVETLFHDELVVICSKRSKWAQRRNVALAELVGEPWVFPPATGFPHGDHAQRIRSARPGVSPSDRHDLRARIR